MFGPATTPAANANMLFAAAVWSRRLPPKSMATLLPNSISTHSKPRAFFSSLMTRGSSLAAGASDQFCWRRSVFISFALHDIGTQEGPRWKVRLSLPP
jgi:hypothetical protein